MILRRMMAFFFLVLFISAPLAAEDAFKPILVLGEPLPVTTSPDPMLDDPRFTIEKMVENAKAKADYSYGKYTTADVLCSMGISFLYGRDDVQSAGLAFRVFEYLGRNELRLAKPRYYLGRMYFEGAGVERDYPEASKWFTLASDRKLPEADFYLGMMYQFGFGSIKQSDQKMVKRYSAAAEAALPEAQFNLGLLYYQGQGVKRNEDKAVELFKAAAVQGLPEAEAALKVLEK